MQLGAAPHRIRDLQAGQVDLVVPASSSLDIDTDSLTVNGVAPGSWRVATQAGGGPELFVVRYREISVLEGATVTVTGAICRPAYSPCTIISPPTRPAVTVVSTSTSLPSICTAAIRAS